MVNSPPPARVYSVELEFVDRSERFELEGTGKVEYFAYFKNMPLDINHTDRRDWPGDEASKQAYSEFEKSKASLPARALSDQDLKRFPALHQAFFAAVKKFYHATQRPLKSNELPQIRANQ